MHERSEFYQGGGLYADRTGQSDMLTITITETLAATTQQRDASLQLRDIYVSCTSLCCPSVTMYALGKLINNKSCITGWLHCSPTTIGRHSHCLAAVVFSQD